MADEVPTNDVRARPGAPRQESPGQGQPDQRESRGRTRPHEIAHPTLAADTDPEAERVRLAIYREMAPARKLQLVLDSIQASRDLALAGLRARHPGADPEELRRRLFDLELGEELARKVYRPLSSDS